MVITLVRRTRVISLLVALAATGLAAQQPEPRPIPKGTSAIRGRIIDALSAAPIPGCQMSLAEARLSGNSAQRGNRVLTGDDGTFEFAGIIEGNYTLFARCASHLMTCYRLPDATQPCSDVTLARDQHRREL
jgi:hypothetical protein